MDVSGLALERLLVAILVGFLIGLDRERTEARKQRRLFAGVRTFPLIALAGALPMLLGDQIGPILLVVAFLGVAAITVVSYVRASAAGDVGATTEMAALATFLVGVVAGSGQLLVAGATGVAVAVLLVAKPRLEGFSQALSHDELVAVLELAVITVIVLPLVPNQSYGPWNALNPFEIWFVVVLVSGLSFAGFIAVRLLGEPRGILLAGVVGALVSSTAVTVSMATQARTSRSSGRLTAAAAVLASTIMCIRVGVLVSAINLALLPLLLPALAAMTLVGGVAAWLLARDATHKAAAAAEIANPFHLTAALTFAAVFAAVMLLLAATQAYFGLRGTYLAAVLGSLVDVDAVAIAFARVGSSAGAATTAAAIVVATITNTLLKLGVAVVMGAGPFRSYVASALAVMAAAGALAGLWVVWW